MVAKKRSPWQLAPRPVQAALSSSWNCGTPYDATALYARWWQLETWLRSLVYVERSARDGRRWAEALPNGSETRKKRDQATHSYMSSPDANDRLAYLDAGPLLNEVLLSDWDIYRDAMIDEGAWRGRIDELTKIRHRISHCRRPHPDDLLRLEQTLRDLNDGALRAVNAYHRQCEPDQALDDPLVASWIRAEHEDARRLIQHAERQYEVYFQLRYSRRPWADKGDSAGSVSGTPGFLWHASFYCAGANPRNLRALWNDSYLRFARERLVFLVADDPFAIEFSFAAVEDPSEIADAIGGCFDAILTNQSYSWGYDKIDAWQETYRNFDPRVQVASPWSTDVSDAPVPISMFGA